MDCTIHLDPIVTDDEHVTFWREKVTELSQKLQHGIKIHDFRMVPGTTHTNLIFDMEVPFEAKDSDECIKAKMAALIADISPSHFAVITIDRV